MTHLTTCDKIKLDTMMIMMYNKRAKENAMKRTVINRAKMYHYLVQLVDKKNPGKVQAKWKMSTKERMDYRTFILSEPVERRNLVITRFLS